jgi:guanylate kinase
MRIREANLEIEQAPKYDYIVINDDLKTTISTIQSIIISEKCKRNSKSIFEIFKNNQ